MPQSTKQQFELFKKEVRRYIQLFNMGHYRLYFEHDDNNIRESGTTAATCEVDINYRRMYFTLSKNFPYKPTREDILGHAKHEALEALLGKFWQYAQSRWISDREIEDERHKIISRLMKVKI